MKKFLLISALPIFMFSCSCITKVKAQAPQVQNNLGQITWFGSDPSIGPCIWKVVNNVVSTPCMTNGGYTLPIATSSTLGGIKPDGTTIIVNPSTGVASSSSSYTLPTASTTTLGGIKVDGTTITVTGGVASASSAASGPPNIYCVSTNSSGLVAQTINCNAFSYNAGDFINYGGTTGGNNGITNMLAYCATLAPLTCYATIAPSYTGTDTIPGYSLDYTVSDTVTSAISSNTILIDERAGSRTYLTNNWCALSYSNQCSESTIQSVAWTTSGGINQNYIIQRRSAVWQGTSNNYNNGTYQDIANFQPWIDFFTNYGYGQTISHGTLTRHIGQGDTFNFSNANITKGGLSGAKSEEGQKEGDWLVATLAVDYQALITTGGTKVSSIVVGNPTQGSGTLGIGNELINKTTGVLTGTATAQACSGDASLTTPCVVTVSGSPFTVDTARGTIGANIPVGTNTVTPTFIVGSATAFSTSQIACLSDGFETERLFPTNIAGGAITFVTVKPHTSAAILTTGSTGCGMDFGFDADVLTSSTYGTIPNGTSNNPTTPVGSMPRLFKVVGNPANNQITVAWQGKGSYRQIQDNSSCCLASSGAMVNGAFHLYPATTVTAINAGGTSSGLNSGQTAGTVEIGPNNITWNTSDLADSPVGPAQQTAVGNNFLSPLFPSFLTAPNGGISVDFYSIMHGSDFLLGLTNHTPTSFYTSGAYSLPNGIVANTSYTQNAFWIPQGNGYTFLMPCTLACNQTASNFIALGNALSSGTGVDFLKYDQVNGQWAFSVNNGAFLYWHKKDGLELPIVADASVIAPDSGSMKVYYSSTQSCPAFWVYGGSITCFGSGGSGSGNATSIQGNSVATGTFSNAGQAYIWNGSALAITQTNTLNASGWGTATASPSTGTQQINAVRTIRTNNTSSDTIATSDCGGTIIEQFAGTTAIGIPQANSGTGNAVMPTSCFVDIISWSGNTSNLTTTTSNFYSILGVNTSQSFSVSAARKEITSFGGNYYQTQ